MSTTETQLPQEPVQQTLKNTEVHVNMRKNNMNPGPKNFDAKKKTPTSWISNLAGFNPNMGVSLVDTKTKKF
eukprot:gene6591-10754_t